MIDIVRTFGGVIEKCQDRQLQPVLLLNLQLYALWQMEEHAVYFLKCLCNLSIRCYIY